MAQCVYLGHIVGNGMVQPERSKLQGVEAFSTPKTKKEVRCFLGLTDTIGNLSLIMPALQLL